MKGEEMSKQLEFDGRTAGDLRAEFEKEGYVLLRGFYSEAKVKAMESAIQLEIASLCKKEGLAAPKEAAHDGFMALDARRQDKANTDRIHELYNVVRRSDAINRLVFDEQVCSLVKALVGLEQEDMVYVRTQFCRMDSPKNHSHLLNWHQESFISVPGTRSAQLWTPIMGRNCEATGSMMMLKGSAGDGEVDHYIEKVSPVYITHGVPESKIAKFSKYECVTADLSPRDIILFHPHLLHRSSAAPEGFNRVRYTVVAHYINPKDPGFKIVEDSELTRHHQSRCANASEFRDFIADKKGAIY